MFKIKNKLQNKLKEIYDFYGETLQQGQLIEEMDELKVAINKNDRENYIEEMADVLVVWMQLFLAMEEKEKHKLLKTVNYKVNRTLKRIKDIQNK